MNIDNLSMEFGLQKIFDDVSIHIKENERVGIIGVNGAGKTTLFKIILKELNPTNGKITYKKGTRIGFLPQVISDDIEDMNITVFDYLLTGRPIDKLNNELSELYIEVSKETDESKVNSLLKKIGKTQELLEYYDVYSCESILLKIIDGMHIDTNILENKLINLSGGQKSKVAFARLLYSNPEIMLLDEPTNHLDLDTKDFIINYLKNYKGTILVISHDIEFLDDVTNSTLYLNKATHKMELFPGNYEKYLKIKNEREKAIEKLADKQEVEEEKLKSIIAKYIRGNEKKANIAKDRQKKLERLQKDKVVFEHPIKTARFKIHVSEKSTLTPLRVNNLSFGYTDHILIKNLSFELSRGEKFLIVGENGIGKSTLLKLIVGALHPNSGNIELDNKVKIGYYAQEHELLNEDKTILENFNNSGLEISRIRALLGSFLFSGDDINKRVNILSPGERSRVALAKIASHDTNFLILDEPTNHLDPQTQELIADTFESYEGTILLVSHNTEFIDNLGISRMLLLPSGEIKYYDKSTVLYYQKLNSNLK